jgi:hypothetical protein
MSFFAKVGSFAKSTGGAPATQAITGLGFQPKALILWTAGGTVDGTIQTQATRDSRSCIGIVSSTAAADQLAASSTADTAGNGGRRVTQKAFLLTDATGATVVSEASLASFDADGFTLTWSTNSATEAQLIHYIALGGTDVLAKVMHVVTPVATGNFATTGVGFQPNLLINIGSLTSTATALDTGATLCQLRVGAAVGASSRWCASMATTQLVSGQGWRFHRNDRIMDQTTTAGGGPNTLDVVSFDADGFTLTQASAAATRQGFLCLSVPAAAVGTFTKPTGGGPAVGTVTGLSFQPALVMLVSDQDINRANAPSQTGARMGISAFTAADAAASVVSIPDVPNPIAFAYLDKSAKAAVKINNATPALDAEATGALIGGGFSLTWNANDAVATEFGYVAIGTAPLPKGTGRITQRRHFTSTARKPRGAWRRRAA